MEIENGIVDGEGGAEYVQKCDVFGYVKWAKKLATSLNTVCWLSVSQTRRFTTGEYNLAITFYHELSN